MDDDKSNRDCCFSLWNIGVIHVFHCGGAQDSRKEMMDDSAKSKVTNLPTPPEVLWSQIALLSYHANELIWY